MSITRPRNSIKAIRWFRRYLAAVLLYNLGWGIYELTRGHAFGFLNLACVPALAITMAWQTRILHRRGSAGKPRPDYPPHRRDGNRAED